MREKDWRCRGEFGLHRLRSTLVAVPGLFAHAAVAEIQIGRIFTPVDIALFVELVVASLLLTLTRVSLLLSDTFKSVAS
jgi:hypothetical protein